MGTGQMAVNQNLAERRTMERSGFKKDTLADWLTEGKETFGEDFSQWRFICPACGHIQTVQDFTDIGASANNAYQECIGRCTGKGSPKKGDTSGCNWAAYGLFGTLGKGRIVVTDDGTEVEVFQFAAQTD